VGILVVCLGKSEVMLCHGQRRMTEQPLEREYIATIAQELNSESVPEPMRVDVCNLRPLSHSYQHMQYICTVQVSIMGGSKDWIGRARVWPGDEITP
jgi:hypothetical protein